MMRFAPPSHLPSSETTCQALMLAMKRITLLSLFLLFQQEVSAIERSPVQDSSLRRRHLQNESPSTCGRYQDAAPTVSIPWFPMRIQAEDFCEMKGVTVEETGDTDGGGDNVGWIDFGDWMAYDIYLPEQGTFHASFRVSSPDGAGALQLVEVMDGRTESTLGDAILQGLWSLPSTGDWQLYVTTPTSLEDNGFYLSAGWHTIAVRARSSGFNLNWFQLDKMENQSSSPADDETTTTPPSGFVRVSGKSIVDPSGQNLLLQGMGFGGWMVQEPYMMLATDGASAQHEMFNNIQGLVGQSSFESYRQAWLDNYCTQEDVRVLKESGFNSLRAPLHYNLFTLPIELEPVRGSDTWLTEGFQRLDQLLLWCKEEQVYLILDLHAAPGGQGRDRAISDYDDTKPSMWEDSENVRKTIALWVELAKRYRDEPWVAGYDLLNEPNWNFEPGHPNGCNDVHNAPLKAFYDQAITAIRQVDPNHMIVIEGNCWCNNHNGLWPMNDNNVVLSFHRYWIENTVSSIQQFLNWREQYNVPLWMGESGENDDMWYREAVGLLESQNIGWAWWTWKKMEATSSSFSIRKPDGYQSLLDYWAGRASSEPDSTTAFNTMMQVASNARLENVVRNDNVIAALTSYAGTCDESVAVVLDTTKPVRIEAEDYCSMIGTASEETTDTGGGYNVGWIEPGDWLAYRIEVPVSGTYNIEYRVTSVGGEGKLELEADDEKVVGRIDAFPVTGDWQIWETISHTAILIAGAQTIKVVAIESGWNFNWIQLSLIESLTEPATGETLPTSEPTVETVAAQPTEHPTEAESAEPPQTAPSRPSEAGPGRPNEVEPTEPVESGLQGENGDKDDKSSRRPFVISLVMALVLVVVVFVLLAVIWRMRKTFRASKPAATEEWATSALVPNKQELTEDYSESVVTPESADVYLESRSTLVSSQDNTEGSVVSNSDKQTTEDKEYDSESVITTENADIYLGRSALTESDNTMQVYREHGTVSVIPIPEEEEDRSIYSE